MLFQRQSSAILGIPMDFVALLQTAMHVWIHVVRIVTAIGFMAALN